MGLFSVLAQWTKLGL